MVITEHFAWAHMGKTGGDATAEMFAAVPDLVSWASSPATNAKHDPFALHAEAISGRTRVMNIRRLPAWILSRAHAVGARAPRPSGQPHLMPTADEMAENLDADDALRRMTDGPRFPIQQWLRQEHLADDVAALLERFGQLTDSARRGIASVAYRAKSYDHDLASTFTAEQIRRMYRLNPGWAEVEHRAYGGLIDPMDPRHVEPPRPRSLPVRLSRLAGGSRRRAAHRHPESEGAVIDAGPQRDDHDGIDLGGWLDAFAGPQLDAIDRQVAAEGPSLTDYRLFRGLDDWVWTLLLSRRYTTYLSILATLPQLPAPALREQWDEIHGLAQLSRSSSFSKHIRSMQGNHGIGSFPTARILDFGCGWGRLTRFFCRDVDPGCLHACDPDEDLLQICRRSRIPAVLHHSGPEGLSERDFDLAYSSTLGRSSRNSASACLTSLHESLNPGGLLVLTIPPPAQPDRGSAPDGTLIDLSYLRDRWDDRFELVDVTAAIEDISEVAVTLRRI